MCVFFLAYSSYFFHTIADTNRTITASTICHSHPFSVEINCTIPHTSDEVDSSISFEARGREFSEDINEGRDIFFAQNTNLKLLRYDTGNVNQEKRKSFKKQI